MVAALRGVASLLGEVSGPVLSSAAGTALAPAVLPDGVLLGVLVPMHAMGLPGIQSTEPVSPENVLLPGDLLQVTRCGIQRRPHAHQRLTQMIKMQARRQWTHHEQPRSTVRESTIFQSLVPKLAVPLGSRRGRPDPARPQIRPCGRNRPVLVNLGPESLLHCRGLQFVGTRSVHPLVMHRANGQQVMRGTLASFDATELHKTDLTSWPREYVMPDVRTRTAVGGM
jgi:hypothetical protein